MAPPSDDTATLPASEDTDSGGRAEVRFGRYVVCGLLGRGGMGEVFLAHDPELDRHVAVKVVRAALATRSPEVRARFQREAQAMARLNHPNVVAVYDVGTAGDTIYVAMERIDGPTLGTWLSERTREVPEILDVFLQAGRGLAAAHAAGLVHRDFKPANVMLGDRVRVVDFGLARPDAAGDGAPAAGIAPSSPLDASITGAGRVLGTPAYMAPEQREGETVGPLADQYSFALALHQGVAGNLPGLTPSRTRAVPAWLEPILDRALETEPARRYPSMEQLLAALERGRTRTRRRLVAIATGAAVLAVTVAVVLASGDDSACTGAAKRLAGVWDPARRAAVHAAFARTSLSYAEDTWRRVEGSLDGYSRAWIDASTEACRATRVDKRVSEDVLDRTTACLDRGRAELAALTQRWIDATDGKALALAGEAAEGLPRIAACSDTRALLERAPLPSDPALAAKIGEIRAELDRLYALSFSGRHEEIAAAMPALVAAADATGWSQVRAEALYLHGRTSQQLAKPEAEAQLLAANQLATESHDDRLAAEALVYLVLYLGNDERTAERAILVADLADAAIARVPDDPAMKAMLLRGRGDAHETLGKFAEARAAYEQALALVNARIGPTSRQAFEAQARIARVTRESGDVAEGRRLGEAALAGLEKAIGSDHPLIGATLGELAAAAYDLDDYDAAVDYLNRALAIIVRTTGEDSLPTATATQNLASTEFLRGKIEESKRLYERSLAIREHLLGPEHPLVAHSLMGLAQVNQWRGDFEQALDQLQHALAIITKRLGPDHPEVANALDQLGAALATNGKLEEALTYQRRARELRTRILGEDHPSTLTTSVAVAQTLVELKRCADAREILATAIPKLEEVGASPAEALAARGDCEFADGDARSAAATAQRAITACNATSETNPECGSMYWLRARALAKLRRRDEALAAAEEAERRAIANESPEDAAEIHAWIAAHRR